MYLRYTIAAEKVEGTLGDFGWYILKEINIEKWKGLYQLKAFEERKRIMQVAKPDKNADRLNYFN